VEEGYIIEFKESSEFAKKEIVRIEDNILTEENIILAKLMARRYFCNISDCIKLMLPPGDAKKKIENRVKDKTGNFVYLNVIGSKDNVGAVQCADLATKTNPTPKQQRVLDILKQNNGIYISDLQDIADVTRDVIKRLEKNGYVEIREEKIDRNPLGHKKIERDVPHKLTNEQQEAFDKMNINKFKEFLLYGITGSRKNRSIFAIN